MQGPDKRNEERPVLDSGDALRKPKKTNAPGKRRWLVVALLLILVIGVAVGAVLLTRSTPEGDASPSPAPTPVEVLKLVDIPVSDLLEMTVEQASGIYTLVQTDGSYGVKGNSDFPVEQSKAAALFSAGAFMLYDSVMDAPGDLSAYGLEPPAAKIHTTDLSGASRTYLLGNQTPAGRQYYLMEEGNPAVYLVYASTGTAFYTTLQSLHALEFPEITQGMIYRATLEGADGTNVTVGFEPERDTAGVSALWLTSPIVCEADSLKVSAYFDQIAGIKPMAYVEEAEASALAAYGLDAPRCRLSIYDAKGAVLLQLSIGNNRDSTSTFARMGEADSVYLFDRASLAFLSEVSAVGLADRFINVISLAKVDGIDILADGRHSTFAIARNSSETYTLDGQTIPDADFKKLYQMIIGTQADGLLPEGWVAEADAVAALTVRYQLNTGGGEETIEYLPYDIDHYAVRRNGNALFYIQKSSVDIIPEAIAAYGQ